MSLTVGTGPFGTMPAGRFNADLAPPEPLLYFEEVPVRIRALLEGETLADSRRAMLLHESGRLPVYWFPLDDVRRDLLIDAQRREELPGKGAVRRLDACVRSRTVPGAAVEIERAEASAAFLAGHVALQWDAMDEWFAEDEQLFGHPRDPYSRIDVLRTTRHVRVTLDGQVLADSRRARMLVESSLPVRYYLPPDDVRIDLLVPSSNRSRCAYKGSAAYWHVRVGERLEEDLVWSYPEPQHDAVPVRDLMCFFNERVDLELDGEPARRPQTQWSRDEGSAGGAQALRGLMARRG
jgi:uncharacterized protein (DUF427 family)